MSILAALAAESGIERFIVGEPTTDTCGWLWLFGLWKRLMVLAYQWLLPPIRVFLCIKCDCWGGRLGAEGSGQGMADVEGVAGSARFTQWQVVHAHSRSDFEKEKKKKHVSASRDVSSLLCPYSIIR